MTRCDHGGKECPHTYSAFYHPQFPAHPRNNDGSQLVELVAATVTFLLLIAAVTVGLPILFEGMR